MEGNEEVLWSVTRESMSINDAPEDPNMDGAHDYLLQLVKGYIGVLSCIQGQRTKEGKVTTIVDIDVVRY